MSGSSDLRAGANATECLEERGTRTTRWCAKRSTPRERSSWAGACSAAARARGKTIRVANGWWGDDPPFRVPVFVLTHHPRETVAKQGGTSFIFVTDGPRVSARPGPPGGRRQRRRGGRWGERRAAMPQRWTSRPNADPPRPRISRRGCEVVRSARRQPAPPEVERAIHSPAVTHIRYRLA